MDVEQALELVQRARAIGASRGIHATLAVRDESGYRLVVGRGRRVQARPGYLR